MKVKNIKHAHEVFTTLTKALNEKQLKYTAETENFAVNLRFCGNDLEFDLSISVLCDPCVICIKSEIPFVIEKQKATVFSVATCLANNALVLGNFDYDKNTGSLTYKCVTTYENCILGYGTFYYLIENACYAIERFNDKFFALNLGHLTLENFMKG